MNIYIMVIVLLTVNCGECASYCVVIAMTSTITVDKTNWLRSSKITKGVNKAALFYVEQIVTLHIVLF